MKVSYPGIGEIDQIHLLINVYNSVVVLFQELYIALWCYVRHFPVALAPTSLLHIVPVPCIARLSVDCKFGRDALAAAISAWTSIWKATT
jgi:hypothetical protein